MHDVVRRRLFRGIQWKQVPIGKGHEYIKEVDDELYFKHALLTLYKMKVNGENTIIITMNHVHNDIESKLRRA